MCVVHVCCDTLCVCICMEKYPLAPVVMFPLQSFVMIQSLSLDSGKSPGEDVSGGGSNVSSLEERSQHVLQKRSDIHRNTSSDISPHTQQYMTTYAPIHTHTHTHTSKPQTQV